MNIVRDLFGLTYSEDYRITGKITYQGEKNPDEQSDGKTGSSTMGREKDSTDEIPQ
ncbi:hypothetical protein ES703_56001 [subsurface metagenome]